MAAPVLDSFALLALLRDESGGEAVGAILEHARRRDQSVNMTEVNYAEVQYIIRRKDGDQAWDLITNELKTAPIEFHPVDRQLADLAAEFKAQHKLSLADAFAAALAKHRKTELVTGDLEFKQLEKEIKIKWIN